MDRQLLEGQEVRLRSAQGEIVRTVVKVVGDVVLISRREEYDRAKQEGREPVTVGFKISDVIQGT